VLLAGKKVYALTDQKTSAGYAGQKVSVTGVLDATGKTIQVESIGPAR
jgi:hypothetical protein